MYGQLTAPNPDSRAMSVTPITPTRLMSCSMDRIPEREETVSVTSCFSCPVQDISALTMEHAHSLNYLSELMAFTVQVLKVIRSKCRQQMGKEGNEGNSGRHVNL